MILPSITQLQAQVRQDLENEFGIQSGLLRRFINAFAAVQAAKLKVYYITAALVQKNVFPDTADTELDGGTLERFGRIRLERNPFPATQGVYNISVSGEIGSTIAQAITYRNPKNNAVFVVEASVTLTATTGVVSVRSLDAGRDNILEIGDRLIETAPIVGINSGGTVTEITTEPQNAETTEQYRQVVLQSYVLEPQGGAAADYRIWASDAQGVLQVYPFVSSQAGIVNIYIEGTEGNGIPSQAVIDAVREVVEFDPDTTKPLEERGRRPLGAFLINYLSITPLPVDIELLGLSDDSQTVIDDISESISEYLSTIRPFVGGADDPNLIADTIRSSDIIQAANRALSVSNFFVSLSFTVDGAAVTNFRFENGNIPIIGDITNTPV